MKTKSFLFLALLLSAFTASFAQQLTTVPSGGNKKASVSEQIGLATITIHYDRPGVKGREGKLWGTSVAHNGFQDLGFGTSKSAPWRAGANENTTIQFSHDVTVEGNPLPAGTYGLFMALGDQETTVIFSKNFTSWGSYYYDPKEDALRVTVKNQSLDKSAEWLAYEFINQTDTSATIALKWEKRMIPFTVSADVYSHQMASFRNELRTTPGFTWQSFVQAANFCVERKRDMEQALIWADQAVSAPFIGQKNFQTLSTKASVLAAMNKQAEATTLMKEALPMGSLNELHQYARTLLAQKRFQEAYDVFKINYDKNPNQFTTNVGLGRGLSGIGKHKEALPYMKAALAQSPNSQNKTNIENMIKMLQEGKNVN
ncbi:DUF2911 domain-containing protein [Spirosoma soli]|uniref:DUF2911 domain-containing protein n=1 Tax=Spirosoma soli TaxID=1770529 RepID=A0ABW5M092_9BACT